MELQLTMGCICDSYEVDGMPVQCKSTEDIKKILEKQFEVVRQSNNHNELYNLSMYITETFHDDYETSEQCECCGDYIETYKLKI